MVRHVRFRRGTSWVRHKHLKGGGYVRWEAHERYTGCVEDLVRAAHQGFAVITDPENRNRGSLPVRDTASIRVLGRSDSRLRYRVGWPLG